MNTFNTRLAGLCVAAAFVACQQEVKEAAGGLPLPRGEDGKIIVDLHPSPEYRSPEETMALTYLQPGYSLELVASEPMIHEPVAIAWDGNGRMFVAEMNTYMQDVDGTGQMKPVCTVKLLEDTDGDGKMDKATVYLDSLVLPRMLLPVGDRLLLAETFDNSIYAYRDTDGDGRADEKETIFLNETENRANLEHQRNGLLWNLDNKLYVTVEKVRYRYGRDGKLTADTTEARYGQWGLTNDDYGRLYYSSAGGEVPALGFQQNPFYGYLDPEDQYDKSFNAVWPIISTPDVQGGAFRLREDSTLNHFTASTGQAIFRGDRLPKTMQGDLLICEPVGRLIRRAKVTNTNGKITLENAYDEEEFIASKDMNFRPVNLHTGPDGCLYIVDMYRGIIQEGNWTREGSFLRPQILEKKFDKNIGRGRIYRVVHKGIKPDAKRPKMLEESSAQLVGHLEHPNGWWRENAQRLLVLRGDKSVEPALRKMALSSRNHLARIHALWTLEGMALLDQKTLLTALTDKDARIRKTALWIADEPRWKTDEQIFAALEGMKNDPDAEVRFQLGLNMRFDPSERTRALRDELIEQDPEGLLAQSHAKFLVELAKRASSEKSSALMAEAERHVLNKGSVIFGEYCSTCHGADGSGMVMGNVMAPSLVNNATVNGESDNLIKIMLHGLTGPIDGKEYPGNLMVPIAHENNEYIASVLSYIRNNFDNKGTLVNPDRVSWMRWKTGDRKTPYTKEEL